jgi:hypothetical protein
MAWETGTRATRWAFLKFFLYSWALVAHTCNPSYLGSWDQENCTSRPAQANSLQDSIFKRTRAKWTGGVTQAVENLLCKHKALISKPSPTKKNIFFFFALQKPWEIRNGCNFRPQNLRAFCYTAIANWYNHYALCCAQETAVALASQLLLFSHQALGRDHSTGTNQSWHSQICFSSLVSSSEFVCEFGGWN